MYSNCTRDARDAAQHHGGSADHISSSMFTWSLASSMSTNREDGSLKGRRSGMDSSSPMAICCKTPSLDESEIGFWRTASSAIGAFILSRTT